MRQLNPSTNLVLAVLAGLGLLGSLTLPWFAAPVEDPTATDGPIERAAFQVGHVFDGDAAGAVSGAEALGSAQVAILGLVVLIAVVGIAVMTPAVRRQAEDLMRVVVLAAPVVVVLAAVAHPGTEAPVSLHYGLLVSVAACALMGNAAWHGASMRQKHAAPARPRYGKA